MINYCFVDKIRRQISLISFVKDYNYVLITHTIPLLILGMKILEHFNQLYGDKINGIVGFIYGTILIFVSFSITHIKFLNKYTHKRYFLSRTKKLIDDIKFICTLWLVTGILNIIIQLSFEGDILYRLLSLYLIQLPTLFFMIRIKFFGYQLKKRNYILK